MWRGSGKGDLKQAAAASKQASIMGNAKSAHPQGGGVHPGVLCEATNEHRTSNYWTELVLLEPSVPALKAFTHGENGADFGQRFCHSDAKTWSCGLKEKAAREQRAIFPKSYHSRHGALSCLRSLMRFGRKSCSECGAGWEGRPQASK